jgi:hypothetical protein
MFKVDEESIEFMDEDASNLTTSEQETTQKEIALKKIPFKHKVTVNDVDALIRARFNFNNNQFFSFTFFFN